MVTVDKNAKQLPLQLTDDDANIALAIPTVPPKLAKPAVTTMVDDVICVYCCVWAAANKLK